MVSLDQTSIYSLKSKNFISNKTSFYFLTCSTQRSCGSSVQTFTFLKSDISFRCSSFQDLHPCSEDQSGQTVLSWVRRRVLCSSQCIQHRSRMCLAKHTESRGEPPAQPSGMEGQRKPIPMQIQSWFASCILFSSHIKDQKLSPAVGTCVKVASKGFSFKLKGLNSMHFSYYSNKAGVCVHGLYFFKCSFPECFLLLKY